MRALFLAGIAIVATPLAAQDHGGHSGHSDHGAHVGHAGHDSQTAKQSEAMDHCAMGHLPPEQCPPVEPAADDHSAHGAMDHPQHSPETPAEHTHHDAPDHSQHSAEPVEDHSGHNPEPEMDHSQHGGMDHSGHGAMDHSAHGNASDKSAPNAAPEHALPARALEGPRHAADLIWGEQVMAPARVQLARENGDFRTGSVMVERLEARFAGDGADTGYVWDVQAWYGGDLNRVVVKTEGEGEFAHGIEDAEVQVLYSRAITPFFDLQAGLRHDPVPDDRTHFVIGLQGLAPYMLHVDGALFLSDTGDLTARAEVEYDQKITQRLILQPRIEIEASAQDIPGREIAAGLTKIEPGLRMRYEIAREFAPYVGVEYEARLGGTADMARANGQDPDGLKFLAGIRAWF